MKRLYETSLDSTTFYIQYTVYTAPTLRNVCKPVSHALGHNPHCRHSAWAKPLALPPPPLL